MSSLEHRPTLTLGHGPLAHESVGIPRSAPPDPKADISRMRYEVDEAAMHSGNEEAHDIEIYLIDGLLIVINVLLIPVMFCFVVSVVYHAFASTV